jgi:GT2 family glycosyltransferase
MNGRNSESAEKPYQPSVAVLLTCFNRKAKTLRCLEALFTQNRSVPRKLEVTLVDDGSSDGTGDAVATAYPAVTVLKGNGELFWVGGMRLAFEYAVHTNPDYILFLNDDSILEKDALDKLLSTYTFLKSENGPCLLTGTMVDPVSNVQSYGGSEWIVKSGRVKYHMLEALKDLPRGCDVANFNCTLVPREVWTSMGNLDKGFRQFFADYDYCLRAKSNGYKTWIAPGILGKCADDHPVANSWQNRNLSFKLRWKDLRSNKSALFRERLLFAFRHCGALWFGYAVSPYLKTIFKIGLANQKSV